MKEFTAVVADIRLESRVGLAAVWAMSLDLTHFRAGDCGVLEAVTRNGTRLEIAIARVRVDDDGVVWHMAEKPLAAGTEVRGQVSEGSNKEISKSPRE